MDELTQKLEDNFNVETLSYEAELFCEWLFDYIDDHNKMHFYNWIMDTDLTGCSEQFLVAIMIRINTLSSKLNIGIICFSEKNDFREERNNVARKLQPIAEKMNCLKKTGSIFLPDK